MRRFLARPAALLLAVGAACAGIADLHAQAVTVRGRAEWTDRNDRPHPVRLAEVEVIDTRTGRLVASGGRTGADGAFDLQFPAPAQPADLQVRVRARSAAARVRVPQDTAEYALVSDVFPVAAAGGVVPADIRGAREDAANGAFSILASLEYGHAYVRRMTQRDLPQLEVLFPSRTSAFDRTSVHLVKGDRWDWDVALHEYGHYVSHQFGLDNSPGGDHSFKENLGRRYGKDVGIRLAWGEGWPTYFAIAAQAAAGLAQSGIPGAGDFVYSDTEDIDVHLPLHTQAGKYPSLGEDNEVAVIRILFDLHDGAEGGYDPVGLGGEAMWNLIANGRPHTLSAAWTTVTSERPATEKMGMGSIFAEHRAAPSLVTPNDGAPIPADPAAVTWKPNGGWFANDRFVIEAYNAAGEPIFRSGDLGSPLFQPAADEWRRIVAAAAGSPITWVVHGGSSQNPATGLYTGTARKMTP